MRVPSNRSALDSHSDPPRLASRRHGSFMSGFMSLHAFMVRQAGRPAEPGSLRRPFADRSEPVDRRLVTRIELERPTELAAGLVDLALIGQHAAEELVGAGIAGIEDGGLFGLFC